MQQPPIPKNFYVLEDFGSVEDPPQIQSTFQQALEALSQVGGVLLIRSDLARHIRTENTTQGLLRTPPPPAQTREWKASPGVTVIEPGEQHLLIRVPQMSGLHVARTLRMQSEDSLQHWRSNPVIQMDNRVIHGSNSYLDWLLEPVEKGLDRRFYLATARGIRPGQFINIHEGPGMKGGVTRACVKSVGYDPAKKLHYLVADTDRNHVAGAIVQNKNNVGLIRMNQTANSDEQTYDVVVNRYQYAHGDTYMFFGGFNYMSNIHSAYGDENGTIYGAFTQSMLNNFRGKVEAVNWEQKQLRFSSDSANAETLANSRPLINRNPRRWITAGRVWIIPAESYWEPIDTGKYPFQGKTYPTRYPASPVTGQPGFTIDELTLKDDDRDLPGIQMGGLIRGDAECPWSEELIGRFFAVTEPAELAYPGYAIPIHRERGDTASPYYENLTGQGVLRWYQITAFRKNSDGTKDIEIQRFWSGAKSAGSPTLYGFENYSWDGHLRPLRYAIAPGTYVNDVSRAVPGIGDNPRVLGLTPYPDMGSANDFAAGDDIEQAIGPDPFKPVAFRAWLWDHIPAAWPSPVMDLSNWGAASRYAALAVRGLATTLEEVQKRQERKPAWDNAIVLEAACTVGLNCRADFADAAILFQQPNREQPIKWLYRPAGPGRPPAEATLTVSKDTGAFHLRGRGVHIHGPLSEATGLSADATPAHNLRGKNVPVPAGSATITVGFPEAEADKDYAVFIEQNWLTGRAIVQKSPQGFTVRFDQPAPPGGTLDWLLVR